MSDPFASLVRRPGAVLLKGHPFDVLGEELTVGAIAPDFELVTNRWSTATLADYAGKVKLISVVPSLETRVCDVQTRRFNELAAGLGSEVVVLTVSADLPYTQARWCGAAGIERVETLSDHRSMSFGMAYGTYIAELRLDQRSVFVIDAGDRLVHREYVATFGDEPDYDAALQAARTAVKQMA